jgi:GPI ethanolamine phosphate transferase 3 subunit O
VVLLVIDALRFDFMQAVSTGSAPVEHYQNKMVRTQSLLLDRERAILFRAEADAPTVTAQRLRALLTGSFPTMLDTVANFNADALVEDNLVLRVFNMF